VVTPEKQTSPVGHPVPLGQGWVQDVEASVKVRPHHQSSLFWGWELIGVGRRRRKGRVLMVSWGAIVLIVCFSREGLVFKSGFPSSWRGACFLQ